MRKTIIATLDHDRIRKSLARKRLTADQFETVVREDGVPTLRFTIPSPDVALRQLEQARISLFAVPGVLWVDFRTDGPVTTATVVPKRIEFDLKAVVSALVKLKVPYSKSSTTAVRGWHNVSNGFRAQKGVDSVMIVYMTGHHSQLPLNLPEQVEKLQNDLTEMGFVVNRENDTLFVHGFSDA